MAAILDHESRQHTYNEDVQQSEDTPLLQRFPQNNVIEGRNTFCTAIVILLLIILISGVVIGIYLLVIQSNSENVLPPIESPLQMVSWTQWNSERPPSSLSLSLTKTSQVVVVHTDTNQCHNLQACASLLHEMQMNSTAKQNSLPYNFLFSSNGHTFEALGWRQPSPLFPEYSSSALVLAFIGNFTEVQPTQLQLDEAKNFFAESVSLQHLEPSFIVIGKRTKNTPRTLFQCLMDLPQWDSKLSDM